MSKEIMEEREDHQRIFGDMDFVDEDTAAEPLTEEENREVVTLWNEDDPEEPKDQEKSDEQPVEPYEDNMEVSDESDELHEDDKEEVDVSDSPNKAEDMYEPDDINNLYDPEETKRKKPKKSKKDKGYETMSFQIWKPLLRQERKACEEEFLAAYQTYMSSTNPKEVAQKERILVERLIWLFGGKVRRTIRGCSFISGGDWEDAISEANVKSIKILRMQRERQEYREEPLPYFATCYRSVTFEFIRKFRTRKKKKDDSSENDDTKTYNQTARNRFAINNAGSLEQLREKWGEATEKLQENYEEEPIYGEEPDTKEASQTLLRLYVQELMNSTTEPEKALAVMYARVMYQMGDLIETPHLETKVYAYMRKKKWSVDQNDEAFFDHWNEAYRAVILPTKSGASPQWAWEYMRGRTVRYLFDQSARYALHWDPDSDGWSPEMLGKLEQPYSASDRALFGDKIYTELYTVGNITEWATSVNDAAIRRCLKRMMREYDELAEDADRIIPKAMRKLKKGGKKGT